MASFYDSASIITIPSGYKAGTLYSAKPTNGTGDMAFTRTGDTATRVNSSGLIERCITNLALQSNNFSNASWTKSNVNIAGSIADPNGGTTAFSMSGISSTSNSKNISQTVFSSGTDAKIVSIYAKANTHSFIQIRMASSGASFANFDLSSGTSSAGTGAVATMTNIGGGWYRCSISIATTGTLAVFNLVDSLAAVINESSTTTNSVYIWRAQAQTGDFATNYIPTTTAAVTEGPVTNLPRLDYFGSTCPQLLMEPTRTNLALYSQMFDASTWTKTNMSVSGNTTVSLDGYQNADSLTPNTTNAQHYINRSIGGIVTGTPYVISVFAKPNGYNFLFIYHSTIGNAYFNLSNGTISSFGSSTTAKIENYGNGWYRCSIVVTPLLASMACEFHALPNTSSLVYSGNGTSGISLWGAQVEAGAYATSYIPTTAATVTRNFDGNQKVSATSLIGQSEGTLFVDFNKISDIGGISEGPSIAIHAGTLTRVLIQYSGLTGGTAQIRVNNNILYSLTLNLTNQYRNKIAIAYKIGDLAVYVNGVKVGSNALTEDFTTYNLTNFAFNAGSTSVSQFHARTNQALVFKTRLTDAELATLTTL